MAEPVTALKRRIFGATADSFECGHAGTGQAPSRHGAGTYRQPEETGGGGPESPVGHLQVQATQQRREREADQALGLPDRSAGAGTKAGNGSSSPSWRAQVLSRSWAVTVRARPGGRVNVSPVQVVPRRHAVPDRLEHRVLAHRFHHPSMARPLPRKTATSSHIPFVA